MILFCISCQRYILIAYEACEYVYWTFPEECEGLGAEFSWLLAACIYIYMDMYMYVCKHIYIYIYLFIICLFISLCLMSSGERLSTIVRR